MAKARLDASDDTTSNRFVVAGISVTSLRKKLRPALPKKTQEACYRIVIKATDSHVTFAIAGAAVKVPAVTSGPFVAELPYLVFKSVLSDPYDDGAMVVFEFTAGSFVINSITTKTSGIIVQTSDDAASASPSSPSAPPPVITDPLDACVGLPLIAAYKYIRKYGLHVRVASKTFAAQQVEVDNLLSRAGSMLWPVGITRTDLEHLLDRKIGIA